MYIYVLYYRYAVHDENGGESMKNKKGLLLKLETAPEEMTDAELLACVLSKNPQAEHLKAAEKIITKSGGLEIMRACTTAESGRKY